MPHKDQALLSKTVVCKNCETEFTGSFCNSCGQSSNVNRIDYKYLVSEISNNLFQINRGFIFTLIQLFLKPGVTINNFINGKRKQYFKPLAYIFLTSTFYVFVIHILDLNTYTEDFTSGFTTGLSNQENQKANKVLPLLTWLTQNHVYTVLLSLPFFSLSSYLVFIKSGYNYFEHVILNLFITGQQMFIYAIMSFIVSKDTITESIPYLIGVLFNFWAFYKTFKIKNGIAKIFLTFITYVLFSLQLIILITIGVVLVEEINF